MLSKAEENYLKAIYHLLEKGGDVVSTNKIADVMDTSASSVTDMIKKLAVKKLLNYKKYHGATLTKLGRNSAVEIIRKHRLWETFLVNKLNFTWDEVHDIAEQLEHIRSPILVSKLDEFLGFPKFDPHGDPIPNTDGVFNRIKNRPLNTLDMGECASITSVNDSHPSLLKYLNKLNVKIGSNVEVTEKIEFDNSLEIILDGKNSIVLTEEIAKTILVS